MKPKVVISSYDDINNPYYAGGGARAVHAVASRLVKKFDITVLTGVYPKAVDKVVDGVKYKRIGVALFGPRLGQFFFQVFLQYYVRRMKYDVWVESFTPPISVSFLPLATSKPVIGLVHMLSARDMERKYRLPFHWLEKIGLGVYKNFIVLTDSSKGEVLDSNPKANCFVIPNGVNLRKSVVKTSPINSFNYLLFMGRIEFDQKGLDLLINAFAKVTGETNLKLLIAGTGASGDQQKLSNFLAEKQINDRVEILGRVEGEKKSNYFRDSLAVVIPSRYETFSLTALEAMSFRKPIICYDIDGMKWLPDTCALKAKQFCEDDFAKKIRLIYSDKKLRNKIASSQSREVIKFSWDRVATRYGEVISSLLS